MTLTSRHEFDLDFKLLKLLLPQFNYLSCHKSWKFGNLKKKTISEIKILSLLSFTSSLSANILSQN